jgi:anti-sigma factor (TIGR02949 family)
MNEIRHQHPADDDIGCLQAIEWFYAWLDGELEDPEAERRVEAHMAHCRSCYSRSQLEQALTRRLQEDSGERAPESLKARLRKLMERY